MTALVRILAGLAIVGVSFWITLKVMDLTGGTAPRSDVTGGTAPPSVLAELRPTTWTARGKASYQISNGTVTMHGPNDITARLQCGEIAATAKFSMLVVQSSGAGTAELLFFDATGKQTRDPLVQDISGVKQKPVELSAIAPAATRAVEALIYIPTDDQTVIFKDAYIGCISATRG